MSQQRLRAASSHIAVKHELLVRYLDAWTPSVLHSGRRVTYADGYAGAGVEAGRPDGSPGAALRVFSEFSDRLPGHELTMVLVEDDPQVLAAIGESMSLAGGTPAELTIQTVRGTCAEDLLPALAQNGALDAPLLTYLDAATDCPPPHEILAAIARHRANEVLLTLDPTLLTRLGDGTEPPETGDRIFGSGTWQHVLKAPVEQRYPALVASYRDAFRRAGLSAVAHVELVNRDGDAQLLLFGTRSVKNLEKFKTELWAVDEYAGVRYRDPRDGDHELLDISELPSLGPLRRALAAAVAADGSHTVADLRQLTLAETMYRAGEATRAVGVLVTGGALARDPERGRLAADTVLRSA